jgi:RalA-binding protein 1
VQYESETTEDNVTVESSNSSPGPGSSAQHDHPPPEAPKATTKAASTATTKGLNVSVSSRGNRYSTMGGLPMSPRPPQSPRAVPDAVAPV